MIEKSAYRHVQYHKTLAVGNRNLSESRKFLCYLAAKGEGANPSLLILPEIRK